MRACAPGWSPVATTTWRLTDRGLMIVTLLIGMVVVAAVAVVALTAWRVTGDSYAPSGSSVMSRH